MVEYSLAPMGRLFIEPDRDALCMGAKERRRVVEVQEGAEEAHGFDRQSEEGSIVLSYRLVRRISTDKR
jgi:hypothetical protein